MSEHHSEAIAEERHKLQNTMNKLNEAITNITNVIMSGIVSTALTDKLAELEQQKVQIETDMRKLDQGELTGKAVTIDPLLIPQAYKSLKDSPGSPAYKEFVQSFVGRIDVGRYGLMIALKTGLDVYPELDTVLTVRRQEVYQGGS